VELIPDIIVANGVAGLVNLQRATRTIPIVFVLVGECARLCPEFGPSGWEHHRFYKSGVDDSGEMGRVDKGDCADRSTRVFGPRIFLRIGAYNKLTGP
jgi:hypothetical protein